MYILDIYQTLWYYILWNIHTSVRACVFCSQISSDFVHVLQDSQSFGTPYGMYAYGIGNHQIRNFMRLISLMVWWLAFNLLEVLRWQLFNSHANCVDEGETIKIIECGCAKLLSWSWDPETQQFQNQTQQNLLKARWYLLYASHNSYLNIMLW